ncbi:MAG: ATP-dependent DNA helicase [Lachnospiraceae bacterium]|nr:ATP-dependent DNA helicase [Lachnospiraceae bacterium]
MHTIRISVRNLVEFILRSGDITTSSSGVRDADAMQEGTRIHKKLQRRMGSLYRAEVSLQHTTVVENDGLKFEICVEGRADGIFPKSILPELQSPDEPSQSSIFTELQSPDEPSQSSILPEQSDHVQNSVSTIIDEIKGIYREPYTLTEAVPVHRAQALCYAYIYATDNKLQSMGVRMTYCHIPTEEIRYFYEEINYEELEKFYNALLQEYAKWIAWQLRWQRERNASLHTLEFPFPYREGQANLVKGVYQSILRQKRLYIEAPTGVGKTIATVFPAVKAMGEQLSEKIFYLTAKTITRTVAEDTFSLLAQHEARIKSITLTAKDKICILEKSQCHPATCPRAKGHFDRVNDAVFDLLTHETLITRDIVSEYADKHEVCPFEMGLDTATWCDAVIGDYNYAFDPDSHLKRFFEGSEKDYIFLIDEAHNLVDRAREMYSATLAKEDFLELKRQMKTKSKKVTAGLENGNRGMLELKRQCEDILQCTPSMIDSLIGRLLRLSAVFDEFLQDPSLSDKNIPEETMTNVLDFYFSLRSFLNIYEMIDDNYIIYCDYGENGNFRLHLQCMVPAANLDAYLTKGRSAIFFSATLLPIQYYREQLASREDDYAIYAPSPFPAENRLLMIGKGISTKYTARSPVMYQRIASYIKQFADARTGNYMVFFPSYRMMEDVYGYLSDAITEKKQYELLMQDASMSETAREEFLAHFEESPAKTVIALCVMGGIFGEGIDLKHDRLIGAVIVGPGLPMVCNENELFRRYFKSGFEYAYQYPGMNKVLQAAGRVIRTAQDRGAILLLDDRFLQQSYQTLFPREWFPHYVVTKESMETYLREFWKED